VKVTLLAVGVAALGVGLNVNPSGRLSGSYVAVVAYSADGRNLPTAYSSKQRLCLAMSLNTIAATD
jgi:hypothetical protein